MAEVNKQWSSILTETQHSDPPSADAIASGSSLQPKCLLAGLGWNTVSQFWVVANKRRSHFLPALPPGGRYLGHRSWNPSRCLPRL
jgi:hypothetical protein